MAGLGLGMFHQAMRGKHVSAAIMVVAAAILIFGGSYIRHDDTKLLATGLSGWFISVTEK